MPCDSWAFPCCWLDTLISISHVFLVFLVFQAFQVSQASSPPSPHLTRSPLPVHWSCDVGSFASPRLPLDLPGLLPRRPVAVARSNKEEVQVQHCTLLLPVSQWRVFFCVLAEGLFLVKEPIYRCLSIPPSPSQRNHRASRPLLSTAPFGTGIGSNLVIDPTAIATIANGRFLTTGMTALVARNERPTQVSVRPRPSVLLSTIDRPGPHRTAGYIIIANIPPGVCCNSKETLTLDLALSSVVNKSVCFFGFTPALILPAF